MLPLAFNSEGDPFDVPAAAVGWRIKRYQPGRGAPEMVYSSGGLPLVIPIEAGIDELRRAVVIPGKYRLDPVDDHHRVVRDTDTAVVFVRERRAEPPTANARPRASRPVGADPNANANLIESMRLSVEALRINAEIAHKVASRFGAMVEAAASLIRAADGAALPEHQAIHAEHDDSEDHNGDDDNADEDREAHIHDDENEPDAGPPTHPSGLDVNELIAQLATVLLGSRQPAPEAAPAAPEAPPPAETPASEPSVSSPSNQPRESPAVAFETKTPPPAGPQPTPPAASCTRAQLHNAPSLPPDAPVFTARPNASASMSSSAAPSTAAHADAPTATAASQLASIPATPPLASTTEAPDATRPPAVPLANANTDAASRPTKPDVPRNANAMPAAARSSPQVVWVAQETESSGFPFRTSTATPPAPTTSPPPPTPLSSARRRSSASAMGSPPRVHDDDIALQFASTDTEPPPLSEDVVLHFAAILRALRRNEAAHVSAAAGELSLHDLRTWLEDLSLMTVPEAVAYVRELITGSNRLRSVS